jgi:hypothetical protein
MKNGIAIENKKMIAAEVLEEYNGVYSGKWHIVSPEGFDLPEGLEYLKNSWEGSIEDETFKNKERIFKYNAKIKISHVDLKVALKRVSSLLVKLYAYDTDLEIMDCLRKQIPLEISMLRIFPFMREFKITGCYLTYKDLDDIIRCGNGMNQLICLSGNKFVNEQGDKSTTEQIEKQININKNLQESFKLFDLRNCNFSQEEKELLSKKLQYMNLVL